MAGSGPVVCDMFNKEMVDVLDAVESTHNSISHSCELNDN